VRRLKVLISAYACEPEKGSEPGVGWNIARAIADHHDVWVLTRANNRPAIEAELMSNPAAHMRFVYYDLPRWAGWWKRGQRGVQLYYYLWQLGVYARGKKLVRTNGIDLVHHVTFVNYWKPSLLSLLPVPFLWGPVGGGDSAPKAFWQSFGLRGVIYELSREVARWLSEHDPLVRLTAKRSVLALATTEDSAERMRRLGSENVRVYTQVGLDDEEIDRLRRYDRRGMPAKRSMRFVSIGRLLHWKGFHLGLRAFARAGLSDAEYWIVGEGPEREHLRSLAKGLGIMHQVHFWGALPREEALRIVSGCHVLVHPSLHDSGGLVCLESMAMGLPVICLEIGGPAMQVTQETGYRVPATGPGQAVEDLAAAMRALAEDHDLFVSMRRASRIRAVEYYNWRHKGSQLTMFYREIMAKAQTAEDLPARATGA
jgi:glycosyltransferase involved in cell wall biosynthesis